MKSFKRLFEILGRWKYHYLFAAILLVISVGFRILEPRILQLAIDNVIIKVISNHYTESNNAGLVYWLYSAVLPDVNSGNYRIILLGLGILFISISLLRGFTMFVSNAVSSSATENAVKLLRDKLFSHLQKLPLSYHSKTPTGELIQRCTGDVETVRKFSYMQVVEAIRMGSIFIGAFLMMASIHLTFALITITFVPVILIGSRFFFKKETEIWTEHEKHQDRLTTIVQENLSGIRVVKAFAKESYEIEKFTEQNSLKKFWGLKLLRLHSLYWPSTDLLVYTQVALTVFLGGYYTLSNQITVGEYIAFYSYAMLVTWPIRRLGQLISEMGMTSVALDRIYSILNSPQEDYSGFISDESKLSGSIEFENVFFKYNKNEDDYILNGVSFSISSSEKVAFIGPTGSGKTTIISLLMRFYEADSGKILIDGKDIRTYSKSYLRKRFGVVLQKPFLFSTTIKDNIAYSEPGSDLEDVISSAKVAKIHEIIKDVFPKSYETLVGEKGVTLSGGQKQRLTIARTLIKDPDIFVFDDSTSSIDTETEYEIQNALNNILDNKTTIIIAHRLTSIQFCNKIIVLDKGKVIEQGKHEELLLLNGFYKKIYDIQISIEDEIEEDIKSSGTAGNQNCDLELMKEST